MKNNNQRLKRTVWKNTNRTIKAVYLDNPSNLDSSHNTDTVAYISWLDTFHDLYNNPKKALSENPYLRKIATHLLILKNNIHNLYKEISAKRIYRSEIKKIIRDKTLVLDIEHGGLGDWLVFTPLPRLLYETYGIQTFISKRSIDRLRNKDIYTLCFEHNPYCKGIESSSSVSSNTGQEAATSTPLVVPFTPFVFRQFESDKKLFNFLSGMHNPDWTSVFCTQFNLPITGIKPEIYYKPKEREEYRHSILIDKNFISGKKLGWYYNEETFSKVAKKYTDVNTSAHVVEVNPTAQNIFTYCDMIYSCAHFVTTLSGGAALASCFNKKFTVVLPENAWGASVEGFIFKNSSGIYL
jgi:hypothetical protein